MVAPSAAESTLEPQAWVPPVARAAAAAVFLITVGVGIHRLHVELHAAEGEPVAEVDVGEAASFLRECPSLQQLHASGAELAVLSAPWLTRHVFEGSVHALSSAQARDDGAAEASGDCLLSAGS